MSVLSYRTRHIIRRNLSWNNIRFQWAVIGTGFITTGFMLQAYGMYSNPSLPVAVVTFTIMIACFFAGAAFIADATTFPNPLECSWAVRKYDELGYWWKKVSQPARIGTFEGKAVLERWESFDFRSIYDTAGYLIATEQTIDWSSTDPDWRYGAPKDVEVIVTRYNGDERLSLLARLRSPKIR